jgi:hypothetical protein
MRVFGRQVSKWWLLLLLPILVVGCPILLGLFFAGNNLAGAILGPPAIWNRPIHTPSQDELVGRYVESERHSDRPKTGPDAALELRSDGTMTASALPVDLGPMTTTCILSGPGTWRAPGGDQIILYPTSDGTPGTCESGGYSFLEVASRSNPYTLYWVLGDPDSGDGIWLKRQ